MLAILLLISVTLSACSASRPDESMSQPDVGETETADIIGTWRAETDSVTHFYQDGTGITEDDAGIHEFTWEIMSLAYAFEQRRDFLLFGEFRVFDVFRHLALVAEEQGIAWGSGNQDASPFDEDEWVLNGYILVLMFDGIDRVFDFPLSFEGRDTLMINAMNMGQFLSPTANILMRFEWITFTREH